MPPLAVKVLVPPIHTSVSPDIEQVGAVYSVIVSEHEDVQPLLSVTVTV